MTAHKLYSNLAAWWPLLSPPEDYEDEATFFKKVINEQAAPPVKTLLELGSGGGNNAVHLKGGFTSVTLTDLSSDMLAVSQTLNPDCEHVQGDMRTVRLGRTFDVVFAHDALAYMTTLEALQQAIDTAFVHCRAGGLALFVPDSMTESFEEYAESGGGDGDGRSLRYLEWVTDPDENDSLVEGDFVYLLREGDEPLRVEHDHHVYGLFPLAEWLRVIETAGFTVKYVIDDYERHVFIAHKP
jgi:Methyltransferase domain